MSKLIDCRAKQERAKQEIAKEIKQLNIKPTLTIIQVGDDPASNKYINQKIKHGEDVGMIVVHVKLNEATTTEGLIYLIEDEQTHADGLIVQLPLPKHIDTKRVLNAIDPKKDVDCLTLTNQGLLYAGDPYFEPCTPQGIIEAMLGYWWSGANVLIIGRSEIVGKPLAQMLTQRNATVTLAHSKTRDLEDMLMYGEYDVIISAVGKPKAFRALNADILIDVGINFDENGKMCGDFDLENCKYKLATPVPNGIGRMTIIGLLRNTLKACKLNQ